MTLHLLAVNPKVQDRLRAEIQMTIPNKASLNYTSVQGLGYLSNVCSEVLRLYPPGKLFVFALITKRGLTCPFPALLSHREASKDVIIDDVKLPKGTLVHVVPAVIHYNPHIWGDDADKFDPERWEHLSKEANNPYASGSFLNGPRICIGKSFGLLEYKIYVIELLKAFTFSAKKESLQFQKGGPSLRPQGGLWLRVTPNK